MAERSSSNKSPSRWAQLSSAQKLFKSFIQVTDEASDEQVITEIPGIFELDKLDEKIYAAADITVVYARFLSIECYEWAIDNLIERSEEDTYLENVEARVQAKRKRELSRRGLLIAGWATPIVLSVGLQQKALAQVSGHTDTPHTDTPHIDDFFHSDSPGGGHGDASHIDTPNTNAPHFDTPNVPHGDSSNGGHADGPHGDSGRG